jgi:hypothetical protein
MEFLLAAFVALMVVIGPVAGGQPQSLGGESSQNVGDASDSDA